MDDNVSVNVSGNLIGMTPEQEQAAKKVALLVYILQAASFLLGVTSIIGVIINYVKMNDVRGTWIESHFRWQIRTFWFSLLWFTLGFVLVIIGLGVFIIIGVSIWFIYRIAKGWLQLNDRKEMYAEK
ncbi:hypothetical protein [Desulfonatronum sp. SC1]|uniref:DUF4870 family protein n=1 Tax=Desulfonatronum sp. SC1 TaxID=2109626 RepID=UPI0018EE701C|nr:hypothetical protein [Desulfonatronum sp. SC1]